MTKEEKDSLFQKHLKSIKGKVGGEAYLGDAYIAALKFDPTKAKAIKPDGSNLDEVFIMYAVRTVKNMRLDQFKATFLGKEKRHCENDDEIKTRRFKKQYRKLGIAVHGEHKTIENKDLAVFIEAASKELGQKTRNIIKMFYLPLLLGEISSIDEMGDVVSDTDKKAAKKFMAEILTGVM